MTFDELVACWAALVALVEDIRAPQDNLTEEQWAAARDFADNLADPSLSGKTEDQVLAIALAVMLGELDAPELSEGRWRTAERMLAECTALIEKES